MELTHAEKEKLRGIFKKVLKQLNITQVEAAEKLGTAQSNISHYVNGKAECSFERWFDFFNRFGFDVEIKIKHHNPKRKGVTIIK